jgi:hypothetical protein
MAHKVIGAGFGRTGTTSMKTALEILELGPCHHMSEVNSRPGQKAMWRSVTQGAGPSWDEIFANYHSAVDWPAAYYWRELSEHYPTAKVILTLRDAEGWYESMVGTIFRVIASSTDAESLGVALIGKKVFENNLERDHAIAIFEANTAAVQAALPPERLLTYRIGDGWEPLCQFLGKDLPSVPYPRSNSREEFGK